MPTKYRALEGPIRQFLADRDLLIKDLAPQVGLSVKSVSRAFNGEPTTWAVVSKLALALDVAPDAIFQPIRDRDNEVVSG